MAENTKTTASNMTGEHNDNGSLKKRPPKIRHDPTSNKPSPLGHDYEINILTLTYLFTVQKIRKYTNDFHTYIGTEVRNTYPFDDIVYIQVHQGEATSYYIQAKHQSKTSPIKLDELLREKEPKQTTKEKTKNDICLLKYFRSLKDIKNYSNNTDSFYTKIKKETNFTKISHKFVIFTNRPIHKEVKEGLQEITDDYIFSLNETKTQDKQKENFKLSKVKISYEPNSLYQTIRMSLMTSRNNVTEEEIIDFLNSLIFATGQPNVNQLSQQVKEKLKTITGFPDTTWMANTLYAQISKWAHQKDGWFLDRNTEFLKYFDQLIASWKQIASTLNKLDNIRHNGVLFKDSDNVVKAIKHFLSRINVDEPRMCIVYYENLHLTEMKIAQTIDEKIQYEIMFTDLEKYKRTNSETPYDMPNIFKFDENNIIILTVKHQDKLEDFLSIKTQFDKVLVKNPNKKIIFLLPSKLNHEQSQMDYNVIEDKNNSLDDLESLENISHERSILFENHKISLHQVIDNNLEKTISGQLLEDLIKGDVGIQTTHDIDKYERDKVEDYFIPRQLRRICIGNEILKHNNTFFITYGAGDEILNDAIANKDILVITKNNNAVSIFENICERCPSSNIHWLVEEENEGRKYLFWQKSKGTLTRLRDFVVNTIGTPELSNCESQFVSLQNIEDRIVVVAAEPGMGKSTLLSDFEKSIKSTDEYKQLGLLVTKRKLENLSSYFKNLPKRELTAEDAMEFLFAILNFESDIEVNNKFNADENGRLRLIFEENINAWDALCLKVFAYFYNEGKIILLLDGFDEIAPDYCEQVLCLLEALTKTRVRKMIVTTRPYSIASHLMKRLDAFFYTIAPFSPKEQITFFKKYWKCKLGLQDEVEETRLNYFISKCDKVLFKKNDLTDHVFVSVPQHIEMVATVYQNFLNAFLKNGSHICENMYADLNVYTLYEKFFYIKYGIVHENANSDTCREMRDQDRLRKITRKEHGKLAVMEIFGADENIPDDILDEDTWQNLLEAVKNADEKTGIVFIDRFGWPRFVHRTFAEWFAADLLADMLERKNTKRHKDYETARDFLHEKMSWCDSSSTMVFKFLNYKLVSQCDDRDHFYAALSGSFTEMNGISRDKPYENMLDPFNRTPLHLYLCSVPNEEVCFNELIRYHENALCVKDSLFNWTAFHYFVMKQEDANYSEIIGFNPVPMCTKVSDNPKILQDIYGKTPLMYALEKRCEAIHFFQTEIPIAHHIQDCDGNTLLHYWADTHSPLELMELLNIFLYVNANFFIPNLKGLTPFAALLNNRNSFDILDLISDKKVEIIKYFVKNVHDIDLIVLCMSKCKYIWKNGLVTNANLQDSACRTALHHAIYQEIYNLFCFAQQNLGFPLTIPDMSEYLLHHQAVVEGINLRDISGRTVMHRILMDFVTVPIFHESTSRYQFQECYLIIHKMFVNLLRNGADMTIEDNNGDTPIKIMYTKFGTIFPLTLESKMITMSLRFVYLSWALNEVENNDVQQALHDVIDSQDLWGKTNLHHAISFANIDKVLLVLNYRPNLYIKDNSGKIPAEYVFENDSLVNSIGEYFGMAVNNAEYAAKQTTKMLLDLILSVAKLEAYRDTLVPFLSQYSNIALYLSKSTEEDVNEISKTLEEIGLE